VRDITGDEIYTIVDYRNRYALYKLDRDLQAAHHAVPFLPSFDDHEVDNNWAGETSEEDGAERFPIAVPPEIFALRKQMAFQAWYENMPVRRAALPRGPAIRAYRRLRFGRLAEINVLDTRQYRDDQPCGDGVKAPCAAVGNPNAQMLGAVQERWLADGLARSEAAWNVLAQQVMMMRHERGTAAAPIMSMDKWDAYPAARDRMMGHIAATRARGVVVLSDDIHQSWAGELKADAARPDSAALATEFVDTPISTGRDDFEIDDERRRQFAINPHIKYFNNRRGYAVHEATAARMLIHFRAVDYVTRPAAPLVTKASFAVERERPAVVPA